MLGGRWTDLLNNCGSKLPPSGHYTASRAFPPLRIDDRPLPQSQWLFGKISVSPPSPGLLLRTSDTQAGQGDAGWRSP